MGSFRKTKDPEMVTFPFPFPQIVWLYVDMALILVIFVMPFQIKHPEMDEEINKIVAILPPEVLELFQLI